MNYTIAILVGSTRTNRAGDRVGKLLEQILQSRGHTVHLIDPVKAPQLLYLQETSHHQDSPDESIRAISNKLTKSDGFLVITPEYNHSFSGAIKNLLDMFMPEYEKKPFGIVSYSASMFGGIRANEAIRPVISELDAIPTPQPLLISFVKKTIGEDATLLDQAYKKRIDIFLEDFFWYVQALKQARREVVSSKE
ncbi:MAG: NADPH-dependent FMN reductase [Candidatus Woesearchaeota archaeon]